MSARNTCLSSSLRSAISASSAAQIATTGAPSLARVRLDPREQRVVREAVVSSTLATYIVGFIVSRKSGRSTAQLLRRERRPCARASPRSSTRRTFSSTATRRCASLSPPARGDLRVARELLLDGLEVGERELGVDRLDVGDRIDLARDVDDVRRPRSSARRGRSRRSRGCWRGTGCRAPRPSRRPRRGRRCRRTRRSPGVTFCGFAIAASAASRGSGTSTMPTFGLDRAERVVLGGDAGLGERVEERGLADVRQADDAASARSWDPRLRARVRRGAARGLMASFRRSPLAGARAAASSSYAASSSRPAGRPPGSAARSRGRARSTASISARSSGEGEFST